MEVESPQCTSTPKKSTPISQEHSVLLVPDTDDSDSSEDDGSYFGEAVMDTAHDTDGASTSLEDSVEIQDSDVSEDESFSQSPCEPFDSAELAEVSVQGIASPAGASPAGASSAGASSAGASSTGCTAGYKLIFDNIDKNIKPRYMRSESQTRSLHYIQSYALKDRIDYARRCSGVTPTEFNVYDILPTGDDYKSLKNHFSTHVSRIMVEYLPFFSNDFKNLTPKHIPHKYLKEMSMKSHIVSQNLR